MTQENQNKQYYCDTFSEVHAPEKLSRKVMNMRKEKNSKLTFVKRLAVTAASLAALFVGSNAVAYAATGETWIRGFFQDVKRFDGAVIGTEYVCTPGEIDIVAEDTTLTITFARPNEAPFAFIDAITPGDATLTASSGEEIILTQADFVAAPIENGKITLTLPADILTEDTTYTMLIHSLYGSAKADAPLKILGEWECKFTYKQ